MHGFIELFISKRCIKAYADNADLLTVANGNAVAFKLAQKCRSSDRIDKLTLVAAVEVHCRRHAGSENILLLAGKAELSQSGYIVNAGARGVVGQIYILPAAFLNGVDKIDRTVKHLITEVKRAVHIEQKQFCVQKLIHSHTPI